MSVRPLPRAARGFPAAAALLALLAVGCLSRRAVYDDIYQNRRRAFEAWKRAKAGADAEQEVIEGDLTSAGAVLIAVGNDERLGNNKQLLAALEDKQNAKGRVIEAVSAALPTLDLTAGYTRLDRTVIGPRDNYAVDVVLSQPIFRGGAIGAGIRAARLFTFLTDEQIAGTVQEVIFETRRGYYDVLLARELVKVSEGDLKLAAAHLRDVEKKKNAGVASEYDVLRAQVEVSNVEAELIERQNALNLAMTALLRTLGVSQESRVRLVDPLTYHALTPDIEDAVWKAFRRRPEIWQAELSVRLNREAVHEAWAGFLPVVDANLTHSRGRPDPVNVADDSWRKSTSAALVLSWPLFSGFATVGRVLQARSQYERAVIELADVEEQVLLDVRQATLSVQDADKFVKSQQKNLERAREGLRLADAGYQAGVNTELEMLDARQALSETQALYYQAVYDHQTAKLRLERAVGTLRDRGTLGGLIP
jgi:outer membrane protein TolC